MNEHLNGLVESMVMTSKMHVKITGGKRNTVQAMHSFIDAMAMVLSVWTDESPHWEKIKISSRQDANVPILIAVNEAYIGQRKHGIKETEHVEPTWVTVSQSPRVWSWVAMTYRLIHHEGYEDFCATWEAMRIIGMNPEGLLVREDDTVYRYNGHVLGDLTTYDMLREMVRKRAEQGDIRIG